jgi:DNA polymerase III delta prime subunit
MGSLLITTMAQEGMVGLENQPKKLHPFFSTTKSTTKPAGIQITSEHTNNSGSPTVDSADRKFATTQCGVVADLVEQDEERRKRRRMEGGCNLTSIVGTNSDGQEDATATLGMDCAAKGHNDRVILSSNDPPNSINNVELYASTVTAPPSTVTTLHADGSNLNPSSPSSSTTDVQSNPAKMNSPAELKKILIYNPKTGTIGSPPKAKSGAEGSSRKSGRKKASRIVCISYGQDEDIRLRIGSSISGILSGIIRFGDLEPAGALSEESPQPTNSAPTCSGKAKSTHPFFLGKGPKVSKATELTPSNKASRPKKKVVLTSTPCSPKKPRAPSVIGKYPQFGAKSSGLKFPGMAHPLWPPGGMVHVTGETYCMRTAVALDIAKNTDLSLRKSKGQSTTVSDIESVICNAMARLRLPELRRSIDKAPEGHPSGLRLPIKHLESGRKLQRRMQVQLRTPCEQISMFSSVDELAAEHYTQPIIHSAVRQHYRMLETELSAFDRSDCENSYWAQKYAPKSAAEVLQPGREPFLLKEWLENLKVQAVESGGITETESKKKQAQVKPKKRKRNKLDGFIVSSDEEDGEMDTLSDSPDDSIGHNSKRTVIRNGDISAKGSKDQIRLTNTVLISGPRGCGKTAAVYAIAKELGFEVFEINPGNRRSGKDILEKVGDMTRNHLVQQHQADRTISSKGVAEDLDAPGSVNTTSQSSVASFFKPMKKPPAQDVPPKVSQPRSEDSKKSASTSAKAQKQSLILVEEVDILYEEDKQFWPTMISLIAQSKRPFILTCNDESLVPIQSLTLHGIFRFSAPPTSLAVDVLLLIAANEGHVLKRAAVESLYEARAGDLRGCLMDLNYWCQIGVGDRRGGFDWFYPRWPKGCDLDQNGDVVRVISDGTYLDGMGLLSLVESTPEELTDKEEDMMLQSWYGWDIDIGNWHESLDMVPWARGPHNRRVSRSDNFTVLELYDQFANSMSLADICSSGSYGQGHFVGAVFSPSQN